MKAALNHAATHGLRSASPVRPHDVGEEKTENMRLFQRKGKIEVDADNGPSIEAIKDEVYHALFRYGAIAERRDDGISFTQTFLNSMARKPISGLSSGKIVISKTGKAMIVSYTIDLFNYFIGSVLVVCGLAGIQVSTGERSSMITYITLWAIFFTVINIVSPLEFKGFLRGFVRNEVQ